MYEFYQQEKLDKLFPILNTEATAIINFVSCDGNMGYKLSAVIGALYPEVKYSFQNNCKNKKIKKGVILTNKKNFPYIINLPFKETYRNPISLEYVRAGFEKLSLGFRESKIELESIAIQRGILSDEMLKDAIEGLILPRIIYYEEIKPYEKQAVVKEEEK